MVDSEAIAAQASSLFVDEAYTEALQKYTEVRVDAIITLQITNLLLETGIGVVFVQVRNRLKYYPTFFVHKSTSCNLMYDNIPWKTLFIIA